MLRFLTSIVTCQNTASQHERTTVAPEVSGTKAVSANACDVTPIDGDVWNVGHVESDRAKYEWEVHFTGCYLLEVLYPQSCGNMLFSIVPFNLTYANHVWNGFFNQTKNSGEKWESFGHFMFDEGHLGVFNLGGGNLDYIDLTDYWVAPYLRISWWNTSCALPHAGTPESPPTARLIPAPFTLFVLDEHAIHFPQSGCYLLEAKFGMTPTSAVLSYGDLRAYHGAPYDPDFGFEWVPLTVHSFHEKETLVMKASNPCTLRISYVGSICRRLRSMTVRLEGNFNEAAVTAVAQHVVQNIAREAKVEPFRVVKKNMRKKDGIEVELYTIGMENYRGTTLCTLVPGACEASVLEAESHDDLVFVDLAWMKSFRTYFYILGGSLILLAAALTVCAYVSVRRRGGRQVAVRMPPKQSEPVTILGVVVDKEICDEFGLGESFGDDFEKCTKGVSHYVTGRPFAAERQQK